MPLGAHLVACDGTRFEIDTSVAVYERAAGLKQLSAARVSLGAGAAQHNRPFPLSDFRHRTEGEDTPPSREETAAADDDLVRVVSVPLVADVRAIAREHPVASGGGDEAAELCLCPVAPLAALVPSTLVHGREE